MRKRVRLSDDEIKIVKEVSKEVFGKDVEVFVFGSRAFIDKRGGDIDVLVKSPRKIFVSEKLEFLAKLELKGIGRKVDDLIVISPGTRLKEIHLEAMREGLHI